MADFKLRLIILKKSQSKHVALSCFPNVDIDHSVIFSSSRSRSASKVESSLRQGKEVSVSKLSQLLHSETRPDETSEEWYSYYPWNNRPYQCLNCPNSYFKKAHLKRHVTSACNGKEPRYKCPYCTYMSRYSWDTYKHVKRLHENHDVFAIDVLNMIDWDYLSRRRSFCPSQEKTKAFYCPKCPSGFTRKTNLNRHMRHDCGKRPRFKCPYCEMRSKEASNIYRHIRALHFGMRVFLIDVVTNIKHYAQRN
ncbi:re1-silencing transcription factor [Lasius niger]|uniref:Re1-silencing transcription factor n=1 Tax=Lasius niger TaxID=67767 RepID=A0A0J7KK98_LASNI|nr:re1-silencing transcription factor [Lasius niger]